MLKENNKGLTLVELLVTLGFASLILILSFSMLKFTTVAYEIGEEEYDLQASVRIANEYVNNLVRYSTAVFTIPESSFREDNLTPGWDYFGVVNNGEEGSYIANYKYNPSTNSHDKKILLAAKDNFVYEVVFDKNNPHDVDKLIEYTLEAFSTNNLDEYGNPRSRLKVVSEIEGLNSLQVIDRGSSVDPAVAIAYRGDDMTSSNPFMAHVAMVLDKSGSMSDQMRDKDNNWRQKIAIMRDEATSIVQSFASKENIVVSLVPFSTSANNPKETRLASDSQLITDISNLTARGGTNTGDGIRRAYYRLKDYEANNPTYTTSNYVIILVDGVTTFGSVKYNTYNRNILGSRVDSNDYDDEDYEDVQYFYGPGYEGNIDDDEYDDGNVVGYGNRYDDFGKEYVKQVGNLIKTDDYAKVYVIAFAVDASAVDNIAESCGAPEDQVYIASDADGLNLAFTEIEDSIINDISFLEGPALINN